MTSRIYTSPIVVQLGLKNSVFPNILGDEKIIKRSGQRIFSDTVFRINRWVGFNRNVFSEISVASAGDSHLNDLLASLGHSKCHIRRCQSGKFYIIIVT